MRGGGCLGGFLCRGGVFRGVFRLYRSRRMLRWVKARCSAEEGIGEEGLEGRTNKRQKKEQKATREAKRRGTMNRNGMRPRQRRDDEQAKRWRQNQIKEKIRRPSEEEETGAKRASKTIERMRDEEKKDKRRKRHLTVATGFPPASANGPRNFLIPRAPDDRTRGLTLRTSAAGYGSQRGILERWKDRDSTMSLADAAEIIPGESAGSRGRGRDRSGRSSPVSVSTPTPRAAVPHERRPCAAGLCRHLLLHAAERAPLRAVRGERGERERGGKRREKK